MAQLVTSTGQIKEVITNTNYEVFADATAGSQVVTLPTAIDNTIRVYTIKKMDTSSNTVTVVCSGGQTIDGFATSQLVKRGDSLSIVSDGSNWQSVSNKGTGTVSVVKAGTVTDGDVSNASDGMTGVDTSTGQFVYRSGGAWFHLDPRLDDKQFPITFTGYAGGAVADWNGTTGTDNIAAYNAAYAACVAAGGGRIIVPRGAFAFGAPPTVNTSNVVIEGHGWASQIILKPGATNVRNAVRFNDSLSGTPPRYSKVGIRNIQVDTNGGDQVWAAGGQGGGVLFYACDDAFAENVFSKNGRTYCIAMTGCTDKRIENCTADTNYGAGASNPIHVSGTTTVRSGDTKILTNTVRNSRTVTISSATASAGVATYVTATPHKFTAGIQPLKFTGCSVAAYNGYWSVASVVDAVTFNVTLGSTPAASTGGLITMMSDKGIFCDSVGVAGVNQRVQVLGNNVKHAFGAISAECNNPGISQFQLNNNVADDFIDHGIAADNSSGNAANYAFQGEINDNIVVGRVGTTEFGLPGMGSIRGVLLNGSYLSAAHNVIVDVLKGMYLGTDSNIEENVLVAESNIIKLASDTTGDGITTASKQFASAIRGLAIRNNDIDGGSSIVGGLGVALRGNIVDFAVSETRVKNVGASCFGAISVGGFAPQKGSFTENKGVNGNASNNGAANIGHGYRIDAGCDSIDLIENWAWDERGGGSQLQKYGLFVVSGATNIRSVNGHYEGNLTGEVSDGTNGAGLSLQDERDPLGFGFAITTDPRIPGSTTAMGSAFRTIYMRVTSGGGLCSKVAVSIGTVDGTTPGTSDQGGVAVYSNTGIGRNAVPGTRKAVSVSTTLTAAVENSISLTAPVRINTGDWIAVSVASATTQTARHSSSAGGSNKGLALFQDGLASVVPPVTPVTSVGTIGIPLVGIP